MSLRTKYGFNCQTVARLDWNTLTMLGYFDVVPGETITGKLSTVVRSNPALNQIMSRVYTDMFAFYIPFRLLWDEWPAFITGRPSGAIPTIPATGNAPWFIHRNTLNDTGDAPGTTRSPAWPQLAFQLVQEKFFTQQGDTQPGPGVVLQRPSTLETAPLPPDVAVQDTVIDVTSGLSVQALREGLAEDSFQKMRAYYGDKYIDYLAAVGVKADWGILEEPELIAQHHADWRFKAVNATYTPNPTPAADSTLLGQTAGYFEGRASLSMKRTFCPEHGLVIAFGVNRADAVFSDPPQPAILQKYLPEHFWSPERQNVRMSYLLARNFLSAATPTETWAFPAWQEYRMGLNTHGLLAGQVAQGGREAFYLVNNSTDVTADKYREVSGSELAGNFAEDLRFAVAVVDWRLVRHSPIARSTVRLKLS